MKNDLKQTEQDTQRRSKTRSLLRDTRGANYMEYIVLIAVVVLVGIAGWSKFGKSVKTTVESYGTAVDDMKAQGK